MYAPVGSGPSNHQSSLLNSWWLHPPAGGAVGHGCDREGNFIVEGGSERGDGDCHGVGPRGGIMDSHQQQFCLKWNSFGSNLATSFSNLFKSESLTDVTLFCQGVQFKAHRLILAACSKHFQELFEGIPPTPVGLIVILDGTSAHNMSALLEFMYRGEVHVSQESLSSFLKAAECLQVKGLSIEHEKLAVAQRHAAENNNLPTEAGSNGPHNSSNGNGAGNSNNVAGSTSSSNGVVNPSNNNNSNNNNNNNHHNNNNSINNNNNNNTSSSTNSSNNGNAADSPDAADSALRRGIKRRAPTPASPSLVPTYSLSNVYSTAHYYDSPQKRLMSRSPSDVDSLGRASVLRDGAAFRPASAPHPLLENHLYQPFNHPSETPTHPHTAPHTPTELERELERERSEERERNNSVTREGVAEDLRIKQEPVSLGDRERVDKLAERLSGEIYSSSRGSFDSGNYANSTEHAQQQQQQQHHNATGGGPVSSGLAGLPPSHPPTPLLSSAPTTPAMWNTKINKADTVTTSLGQKLKCPLCERLYGYETNLRAHIRQRHQGIRVPCQFCSRTFTRNNTVRRHVAREHKLELSLKAQAQAQADAESVSDSVPDSAPEALPQ